MGSTPGRLLWILGLVAALGAGVLAGSAARVGDPARAEHDDVQDTVTRLQHEVSALQAQMRARDARLAALHERLASAGTAVERNAPNDATARQADRLARSTDHAARPTDHTAAAVALESRAVPRPGARGDGTDDRRSSVNAARSATPPPATVEAALQRFYAYLDETSTAGPAGPWRMRELVNELRAMGDAGAQALLRVLADGGTSDERRIAATLLGSLQDRRALPLLSHIVETEGDLLLRRAAAQGLRRLQIPETIPVLETLLANGAEDRFVRMSAAIGLAQLEKPLGVTGLAHIFDESTADGRGREMAFRALASLKDERPLPFMRQLVTSPVEVSYRLQAIRFVAAQGDRQALGLLQRVMDSPTEQPSIREAAAQAYTSITRR